MSTARTGALLLIVSVVGILGLSSGTALGERDLPAGYDDDPRAVDLLHHSAAAMRTTSYSGTRMIGAWGRQNATAVMVDVEHVAGQGTRLSMRGGGISEVSMTFLETGGGASPGAGELGVDSIDLLTASYAVTLGPSDAVAGRRSTVVEVSRDGAVAARLWIDDETGLLLRREVYDAAGRLARESAFIDVEVDTPGFLEHLPPVEPEPVAQSDGVHSRDAAQAAGWDCPSQAGALQLVGIEMLDDPRALHATYSDGLTRMSVFEQRGSLDARSVRGFDRMRVDSTVVYVREGMPTYAMWERDGIVFTAVTDGTRDTIAGVVRGTPEPVHRDGFWDRVASGMTRFGAWTTPLL